VKEEGNMWCLWDFYRFQHIYFRFFYPLAIIEILGLFYFGYYVMKTRYKKRRFNLKIFSLLMVLVVPPLEIFLTCYPPFVAFFKSILLVVLMWLGVGVWHLLSRMKKNKNSNQLRNFGLKPLKK